MVARYVIAVLLVVVGVILATLGVVKKGAPWGFRGHKAALLEAVGNVEVNVSDERRIREHRDDAAFAPPPGFFLDVKDELRAGRYSEARIRFPEASVAVEDGTRITAGETGLVLSRGLIEVQLTSGAASFDISLDGPRGTVSLRGGTEGATVRILSDGKNDARVFVKSGAVSAKTAGGEALGDAGSVLVVTAAKVEKVARPTELQITGTCDGTKVTVQAPAATQLFVGGTIFFPDDGRGTVDVTGKTSVSLFARDVSGNAFNAVVPCIASPPPPAPKVKRK